MLLDQNRKSFLSLWDNQSNGEPVFPSMSNNYPLLSCMVAAIIIGLVVPGPSTAQQPPQDLFEEFNLAQADIAAMAPAPAPVPLPVMRPQSFGRFYLNAGVKFRAFQSVRFNELPVYYDLFLQNGAWSVVDPNGTYNVGTTFGDPITGLSKAGPFGTGSGSGFAPWNPEDAKWPTPTNPNTYTQKWPYDDGVLQSNITNGNGLCSSGFPFRYCDQNYPFVPTPPTCPTCATPPCGATCDTPHVNKSNRMGRYEYVLMQLTPVIDPTGNISYTPTYVPSNANSGQFVINDTWSQTNAAQTCQTATQTTQGTTGTTGTQTAGTTTGTTGQTTTQTTCVVSPQNTTAVTFSKVLDRLQDTSYPDGIRMQPQGFDDLQYRRSVWTPVIELGVSVASFLSIYGSFSPYSVSERFTRTSPNPFMVYGAAIVIQDAYPFVSNDPGTWPRSFDSLSTQNTDTSSINGPTQYAYYYQLILDGPMSGPSAPRFPTRAFSSAGLNSWKRSLNDNSSYELITERLTNQITLNVNEFRLGARNALPLWGIGSLGVSLGGMTNLVRWTVDGTRTFTGNTYGVILDQRGHNEGNWINMGGFIGTDLTLQTRWLSLSASFDYALTYYEKYLLFDSVETSLNFGGFSAGLTAGLRF
jgi:hypothetical protein